MVGSMLTRVPGGIDNGIAFVSVQAAPCLIRYKCLWKNTATDKLEDSQFIHVMALSFFCIRHGVRVLLKHTFCNQQRIAGRRTALSILKAIIFIWLYRCSCTHPTLASWDPWTLLSERSDLNPGKWKECQKREATAQAGASEEIDQAAYVLSDYIHYWALKALPRAVVS